MDAAVVAALAIVVGSIAYSAWKRLYFSIVASIACIAVFILTVAADALGELAFMPGDLLDPGRVYTVLTSMFSHADVYHIFYNLLGLVFLGMIFEQRIGTRPFILLYLISGLFGVLAFAALRWDDPLAAVVGASGAISGVLGGFARLYPNERLSMMLMFIPMPPMPVWVIVLLFIGLQFLFIGGSNIAVESHFAGLAAGIVFAPLVKGMRLRPRAERTVSYSLLSRLAVTPELRSILKRIENEEVPDVRSAWVDHFFSKARCPRCGARLAVRRDAAVCERGHEI
ncbi:MAG: hypothetical protein A3K67_02480 [Euryarchaeota archaeon RBG_16_62_10]|nr:MAG: hypothetical protein A3K67_02480 [Euryarchaeota archaeon RBG_16_62_10]